MTVYEYKENSKLKKKYSITEKGLKQFQEWISTPLNLQKVKNMEEGKFFFLGMAPKETRIKSIQEYISSLTLELEKLIKIKEMVANNKETVIQTNVNRIRLEVQLEKKLLAI